MKQLVPKNIDTEPDDKTFYPDYFIFLLIQNGHGAVEGDVDRTTSDNCRWLLRLRDSNETKVIVSSQRIWIFRNILARFALRIGDHNPYGGESRFFVRSNGTDYRFSLHTLNEPSLDYWYRLYLYEILPSEDRSEIANDHTVMP